MSMPTSIQALNQLLENNLPLHIILENEVNQTPYGTITVNVQVKNGTADIKTLSLVKNKRKKY